MELVPRKYTEAELKDFQQRQNLVLGEVYDLHSQKKAATAALNGNIQAKEKELRDLHLKLAQGFEMVEVEAGTLMNTPSPGMKRIICLADSTTIRDEQMTPAERQRNLFDSLLDDPDDRSHEA